MSSDGGWIGFEISDDALERQAGTLTALVPTLLLASYCFTCKAAGFIDAEHETAGCDDSGKGNSPPSHPRCS